MIYLDTHVVLWLYQKEISLLSKRAIHEIEYNDIFISPMVFLEIEFLYEIDRITEHAERIINYLLQKTGLSTFEYPFFEITKKAAELKWTRDPFDRIITAQAMLNDTPLITKDSTIRKNYSNALW